MAERRMFSKKIIDDDKFINLSSSAQALYLHLLMSADDDGFCNQVSLALFKSHATVQDLDALIDRRFIYQFESGVIVIRHWRMANAIRKDRYTSTIHTEEMSCVKADDNGVYSIGSDLVANRLPQDRLGKFSIDKDNTIVQKSDDFERFWSSYPRKQGKKEALDVFKRIKGVDVQTMIEAVENQKKSEQWTSEHGRFIPLPATWLNQGRWEDEMVMVSNSGIVYEEYDDEGDAF